MISMIWAMGNEQVIGLNGTMPWRLPRDMAFFKEMTLNKPIVMGRKTWESFGSKPLPNRTNIVLTRDPDFRLMEDQGVVIHDIEDALPYAEADELMVIGGSQIYELMLSRADRLYCTFIDHDFEGDTYFPEVDWDKWKIIEEVPGITDEKNPYSYRFVTYERKGSV
ncbi:trimethoprim-sensitive dihydrofolate reductase [Paenibacillus sp. JCM 10914]|uniref:dihydrofolate reductase n=1 Tax=Paenibacillus sp. JCM 10914 TaxID=1236974 RepID=UPI0003CC2A6E|nr:dihydrofolate reductase [Paenibacillus sp. JCM 10914]GAE05388.1 dihydrofolate reductase [Paenibacillus sp. JCM 10914]